MFSFSVLRSLIAPHRPPLPMDGWEASQSGFDSAFIAANSVRSLLSFLTSRLASVLDPKILTE